MSARWQAAWAQRSPAEQRALRWGAAALAALLLWAVHDWSQQQTARLNTRLPALVAQTAAMQAVIPRIAQLRDAPASATRSTEAQKAALLAAARAQNLALEIGLDGGGFAVRGLVDFDRWVDWLARVQAEQKLRPIRVQVMREGNAVRVEAQLANSF